MGRQTVLSLLRSAYPTPVFAWAEAGPQGGQEAGGRKHGLGYREASLEFQQPFVHDYPLRVIQDS